MPEHRIHVTIKDHGKDPENGERFLSAFMKTHPEVGPSVSQNTSSGDLSVTFSLEADDANEAFEAAQPIFLDGANASGLKPTPVIGVEVSLVQAEEHQDTEEREPVPA